MRSPVNHWGLCVRCYGGEGAGREQVVLEGRLVLNRWGNKCYFDSGLGCIFIFVHLLCVVCFFSELLYLIYISLMICLLVYLRNDTLLFHTC